MYTPWHATREIRRCTPDVSCILKICQPTKREYVGKFLTTADLKKLKLNVAIKKFKKRTANTFNKIGKEFDALNFKWCADFSFRLLNGAFVLER